MGSLLLFSSGSCGVSAFCSRSLLSLVGLESLLEPYVHICSESSAYNRSYDEYPEALEGIGVAVKSSSNSGADASCGVYRCTCKTDAEDMNESE